MLIRFFPVLTLCLSFLSCSSFELIEWQSSTIASGYDFREYTEKGFLFTPEKYSEPYEAIGLVEVTYVPTVKKAPAIYQNGMASPNPIDGFRTIYYQQNYYYIEMPDTDKLIQEMYDLADELGANALTNFMITTDIVVNNNYSIETYKISGFAIKRL